MAGLPGAYRYCPDKYAYAYVAACTADQRIFALAFGMSGLALRAGPADLEALGAPAAEPAPEIGEDWFTLPAAAPADLRRWCQRAFTYVSRL